MAYKLLAGHTSDEQFLFLCTSIWALAPLLLLSCPEASGWAPRQWHPRSPWIAILNFIASLMHWSKYEPRSWRQVLDVSLAGVVTFVGISEAATLCGSWNLLSSTHHPQLATLAEGHALRGLMAVLMVLLELDVFHTVHFGTTHVTGTVLHMSLRCNASCLVVLLTGRPRVCEPSPEVAFAALLCCTCFGHFCHTVGCLWLARRWGLQDRKPTVAELAIANLVSTAFVVSVYIVILPTVCGLLC